MRWIVMSVFISLYVTTTVSSSIIKWNSYQGLINFIDFTSSANPITVNQTAHFHAVFVVTTNVTFGGIASGFINVDILSSRGFNLLNLNNISLCESPSNINCSSFTSGNNSVGFDFFVPKIAAGHYVINVSVHLNKSDFVGGLTFEVEVSDPAQDYCYHSYLLAVVEGTPKFGDENYTTRELGDVIQVKPWATFINVTGSDDVVEPNFDPSGYVWSMIGNMTAKSAEDGDVLQTFEGSFSVGYTLNMSSQAFDELLLAGDFKISITYKPVGGNVSSKISGDLTLTKVVSVPLGWSQPITLERFSRLAVNSRGANLLTISASLDYCGLEIGLPEPIIETYDKIFVNPAIVGVIFTILGLITVAVFVHVVKDSIRFKQLYGKLEQSPTAECKDRGPSN